MTMFDDSVTAAAARKFFGGVLNGARLLDIVLPKEM